MFHTTVTPENVQDHIEHLVDYMDKQLTPLASPAEERYRDRIVSARIALGMLTQIRDGMRVRAAWLRDREQVAAVMGSVSEHIVQGGYGQRQASYCDGTLALRVWEWMQLQPTTLEVGVSYGNAKDESAIPLPDDWWTLTREEQQEWADEALEVHVSNNIGSWWNLLTANGEIAADRFDPSAVDRYDLLSDFDPRKERP